MKMVLYDCEIVNAIPTSKEPAVEGIRYCKGWQDFTGMGVSVICAYVWGEGYRVFLEDNLQAFKELVESHDTLMVGYNNRSFDDQLLEALRIDLSPLRSFDLLRAVRVARGDPPGGVGGPGLDRLCKANFLPGKSGHGAHAPVLWQQGKRGEVIDYCLNDVIQLKKLMELVIAGRLRDADSGRIIEVTMPAGVGEP